MLQVVDLLSPSPSIKGHEPQTPAPPFSIPSRHPISHPQYSLLPHQKWTNTELYGTNPSHCHRSDCGFLQFPTRSKVSLRKNTSSFLCTTAACQSQFGIQPPPSALKQASSAISLLTLDLGPKMLTVFIFPSRCHLTR